MKLTAQFFFLLVGYVTSASNRHSQNRTCSV